MAPASGTLALIEHPLPQGDKERARHLEDWRTRLPALAERLGPSGSLLLVARNGYEDGRLVPWPYQVAEACRPWLDVKNVYVRLTQPRAEPGRPLADAHELCFFLVRSRRGYVFDKAPLRQPHVFKDLEWGKRSVGPTGYHDKSRTSRRYPEGGRDPGNVFCAERRAADGSVASVLPSPCADAYLRLALACSQPGWTVLLNVPDDALVKGLQEAGRTIEWR